jgi:AraC family transcriptional regulator
MQLSGEVVRVGRDDSGIVCQERLYGAGVRLETHAHESPFFGLALDGAFSESVGRRQFDYGPRSVVYRGAGEEHSVIVGRANVRCFVVELDAAEIEKRYALTLPACLRHTDSSVMAPLLTTAYREFRHPDCSSWLAIEGLVLQLLVTASRTAVDASRPRWLDRVAELLRERFRCHLTLEEIAADVGVSPARVSTLFRTVYRRSLAEEQRRLRVEFACRRLLDTGISLADIALEAGFADQPHFSRTFKAQMGMTPAQYRDVLRGEGGRQQPLPPSSIDCDCSTFCGCT